jgi:hypothetical protein
MGIQLYLKSTISSKGTSAVFIYAQHKGKVFKKNIGVNVSPVEWNKKTYQVKNISISSIAINKKLQATTNLIREVWGLFESDIYTWDELCTKLKGGKPEEGVEGFIEDVLKPRMKLTTYQSYKYSYKALLKVLDVSTMSFKELNYDAIDKAVMIWKNQEKSPSSIETYLKHLGVIINEANDRGIVNYRFEKKKKWRVKKHTKVVESATTEQLLDSIKNVNNIYDFQAFAFWLLMFCMRGLYPRDIVKMHLHELVNESEQYKKRYVKHKRSKTGEPMNILYSCEPTEQIINSLQCSITYTHLNRSISYPDVYPKGWHTLMMFEYKEEEHKNVWDVYTKRCRKITGVPFKVARKTFESYALLLDVSAEVRYRLLGHQDRSIKSSYQNWEWDRISAKVDEAHLKVLKEFRVEEVWYKLRKRGKEIGLPESVVTRTLMLSNPRDRY